MGVKHIMLHKLTPGMKIAEDVYKGSQLVVKKNRLVSQEVLDILHYSSIVSVAVFDGEDNAPAPAPAAATSGEMSHSEKLRSSETFKKFEEEFNSATETVTHALNDIAKKNEKISVDELFASANNIMENATNTYQLMDILSNIRYFDDSTYAHSLNVALLANILGRWLNFDEEHLKMLTVAGMLHDIGKVLIPKEIIQKPGKLTEEEFKTIKQHPVLGYKLLKSKNVDDAISFAALMHHEKCDGTGYPTSAKSNQIYASAKLIAIIDVYEAMTANRCYRDGICPFQVIRMFEDEGYAKYEPSYMIPFLRGISETYLHNTVLLNDGSRGEIVLTNNATPSKPGIMSGNNFIDLAKRSDLTIEKIL